MKRDLVGKLQATGAAIRYRHPARGLRIIAIAGAYGKTTTARLLSEVLQEAGQSVLTLTSQGCWYNQKLASLRYDTSAQAAQRCLALAKRKNVNTVILEVTDAFVKTHVLPTITIEMSIITSDSMSAQALLNQPVNYTVVPSGFDVDGLSVAPHQAISYGDDELAEARLKAVRLFRKGTEIDVVIDHQTNLTLATHLIGHGNARNVAAATAAAYVLAVDLTSLEEGIARLEAVTGNFEYLSLDRTYTVAVDRAVHPDAVNRVLDSAVALKKRRLLVTLDSSIPTEQYDSIKHKVDRILAVGEGEELPGVAYESSPAEAVAVTLRGAKKDDLVLLLGAEFAAQQVDGQTMAHRIIEVSGE